MQGKLRPKLNSEYITQGGSKFYNPAPGSPELGVVLESIMDRSEIQDVLVDFLKAEGPNLTWTNDAYDPEMTMMEQKWNALWGEDDRDEAELLELASQSINGLSDLYFLTGFAAVGPGGSASLGEYMPKTVLGSDPDLDFFREHTDSVAYISPATHKYNTPDGPEEWVMDKELALKVLIHEGLLHGTGAVHPQQTFLGGFTTQILKGIGDIFGKDYDLFHQNYDAAVNQIFNMLSEEEKDLLYYHMFPDERIEPTATYDHTK